MIEKKNLLYCIFIVCAYTVLMFVGMFTIYSSIYCSFTIRKAFKIFCSGKGKSLDAAYCIQEPEHFGSLCLKYSSPDTGLVCSSVTSRHKNLPTRPIPVALLCSPPQHLRPFGISYILLFNYWLSPWSEHNPGGAKGFVLFITVLGT